MNYKIIDEWASKELVEQAVKEWPIKGWFCYDSILERKRTLNDWNLIPDSCRQLLYLMFELDPQYALLLGGRKLVPDTMLYGGGLHEIEFGGWLDLHLDADRHKINGMERRANAILFLSGSGNLELWGGKDTPEKKIVSIKPVPGRLVIFETNDYSFHGVPCPLAATNIESRKSLAVYWWSRPLSQGKRPRAKFVSSPGEGYNAEKNTLRAARLS